jgi:hypothetical protein
MMSHLAIPQCLLLPGLVAWHLPLRQSSDIWLDLLFITQNAQLPPPWLCKQRQNSQEAQPIHTHTHSLPKVESLKCKVWMMRRNWSLIISTENVMSCVDSLSAKPNRGIWETKMRGHSNLKQCTELLTGHALLLMTGDWSDNNSMMYFKLNTCLKKSKVRNDTGQWISGVHEKTSLKILNWSHV